MHMKALCKWAVPLSGITSKPTNSGDPCTAILIVIGKHPSPSLVSVWPSSSQALTSHQAWPQSSCESAQPYHGPHKRSHLPSPKWTPMEVNLCPAGQGTSPTSLKQEAYMPQNKIQVKSTRVDLPIPEKPMWDEDKASHSLAHQIPSTFPICPVYM